MIAIDDPLLDGPMVSQLFVPPGLGRYPDGAPVIVYVHGSWATNFVPLEETRAHLNPGIGAIEIYINLPGGEDSEWDSPGTNDRRGAAARQGAGAALRYAAGWVPDTAGCFLADRSPSPVVPLIGLAAFSNGGNLAWATLADDDVALPEVVGVATHETPASGQFVLVEPGTTENPSPLYTPGSCDLDAEGGIVCDLSYSGLAFDASWSDEDDPDRQIGALFIDTDSDGSYGTDDFRLGALWSPTDNLWVQSLQAQQAAEAAGITMDNRLDAESTAAFWSEREAPRQLAAAVARFPDIAAIVSGTEEDHVLTGATDHPHITGMIAAMAAAGVSWYRLHPDSAYSTAASRSGQDFPDLLANTPVAVGADEPMLPNVADGAHGPDYLTASITELLDRAYSQEWALNLDAVLYE